ncbi:hypothetical protein [Streptomyces sp. SID2563]|uniref:hypothetical protein n=1 Tax=Streptomyces sp. SID2563 TaxID=2690255 RepID=UPI0019267AC1|nr:hypothetical protein [Streptomyces sp. SID2563]
MFQARPPTTTDEAVNTPRREGRLPRAWRAAHEPAAGVPRWARRVAYAVPLVVLPSGIWRLGVLFAPDKRGGAIEDWAMNGYVVFLTLISEALAFTAVASITTVTQTKINGDPLPADHPSKAGGWEAGYFYAAYAPLVLWGPMLGILTYAYWRRRGSATAGPLTPSPAGSRSG